MNHKYPMERKRILHIISIRKIPSTYWITYRTIRPEQPLQPRQPYYLYGGGTQRRKGDLISTCRDPYTGGSNQVLIPHIYLTIAWLIFEVARFWLGLFQFYYFASSIRNKVMLFVNEIPTQLGKCSFCDEFFIFFQEKSRFCYINVQDYALF